MLRCSTIEAWDKRLATVHVTIAIKAIFDAHRPWAVFDYAA